VFDAEQKDAYHNASVPPCLVSERPVLPSAGMGDEKWKKNNYMQRNIEGTWQLTAEY
jgi:hypothetical protein